MSGERRFVSPTPGANLRRCIEGVKTTVDFCRELLADPRFRAGGVGDRG